MGDLRQIPLTLTSGYASTWGAWEGVRELVQNWHDGLYEMADNLDIVSSSPLHVYFKKKSTENFKDEFEAFVINPTDRSEIVLGVLMFDGLNNRLTLINKSTSLHKRILLMGYSAKTEKREVIGQFGEGLKVGALSLVRDGRPVTMETSQDRWRFDLVHNEEFGEKVLTVIISARHVPDSEADTPGFTDDSFPVCPRKLEATDTCTSVTNVSSEEWKMFLPRFLFLQPPKDCVKTELGTLLLDDLLTGQLYVKGVWVSDLREEDLAAGVDFASLQLDRDRNAVPRPSEIDHLVSGIWIRAVNQKPLLLSKYYDLLLEDKYRDVRHAAQYVTDTNLPELIYTQFLLKHGKDAVPVLNTISMEKLQEIRQELPSKVVLCNQTFLNILNQSGNHTSVEEVLFNLRSQKRRHVPYSDLSSEKQNVLRHAIKLIQLADPGFSLGVVDVVHTRPYETCVTHGNRVVIPHWMLELDVVHTARRLCSDSANQCQCREAWISCVVLELRKDKISHLYVNSPRSNLVTLGNHGNCYSSISPLQPVVALLAQESCARTVERFCTEVHKQTLFVNSDVTSGRLVTELREREKEHIKTVGLLEKALADQVSENTVKFSELRKKLELAEKEVMNHEICMVDAEDKIRRHCEAKLQEAKDQNTANWETFQGELKRRSKDIVVLQQDVKFKDEQLKRVRKQMENEKEVFRRKEENLIEELRHYIEKHRKRTELLTSVCSEGAEGDDEAVRDKCQRLAEISNLVLQDLQAEKFLCAVCKMRRKDSMFQPCGHYAYCNDCASSLLGTTGNCPLCKSHATGVQIVFE